MKTWAIQNHDILMAVLGIWVALVIVVPVTIMILGDKAVDGATERV